MSDPENKPIRTAGGAGTRGLATRPDTHAVPTGGVASDQLAKSQTRVVNPVAVLDRLSLLLQLQRRARTAEDEELPFIMANETRQLLKYRQAALFSLNRGRTRVQAVSGLAVPDPNAPYVQWLSKFAKWRLERADGAGVERVNLVQVQEETKKAPVWLGDWKEWLPPHLLWGPLNDPRGGFIGILLAFRDEPYSETEVMLFSHLLGGYAETLALSQSKKRKRSLPLSPILALALLAAIAAMFYPVRQSVLAPSEVTAKRPALVRAGLDGVVDQFLVQPNQEVEAGDPLIRLEDAQLRTKLAVAKKAEDMAQAEYRQLLQAGLSDPRTKQRIPLAQGRIEQLAAETAYIESLMERVLIHSPIKGVVLCDNPDEWLGRPVSLGQRIMLVADPHTVELEIRLPASDSMQVNVGDELMFFPNISPIEPKPATVSFVGYRAGEVAGVGMAFILRADIDSGGDSLLGLRGMAKLYGPSQSLGLVLLRKPIMAVRQWLGL